MSGDCSVFRHVVHIVSAAMLLSSGVAFAGGEMLDQLVRFSTPGIDRYADGTIVADGECYALVWSPKGSVFAGFNADGTAISSADRVVLAGALAKDGKCRDAIFQIPAAEYAELEGGEWAVCLVDTRTAGGVPAGVANNVPLRVNRWGAVKSGVKIEPAGASGFMLAAASKTRGLLAATGNDSNYSVRAGVLSAVPDSVKPPKITAFEVSDGVARLTVTDTVPFLTYTLASGDAPSALATDTAADRVDGDTKAEIAIETDAVEGSRFFKVTRAE